MKIFSFLTGILLGTSAFAQVADMGAGIVPPKMQKPRVTYVGSIQPDTRFGDDGDKASLNKGTLIFAVPFAKTDEDSWTISSTNHWMDLYPDQTEVPDLYQFDVGLTYTKATEKGRFWAVNGNFGSASDKPFKDASVTTLSANYFYLKPVSETGTWLYLINYSNNRPILNNIPLPGFAYIYTPSKTFRGTFGAPFAMINWQFAEKWGFNFFTIVPWIIKTSVDYSLSTYAKAYTGLDFSQSTYYLYDRADKKDRLFYDEKKIFLGVKTPLSKALYVDAEGGFAFDRRYFSAENYEPSPSDALVLGSSPYIKLTISINLDPI